MREIVSRYWHLILLVLLSGLITWPVFLPGYFSHHDDLQVMRIFEMRKCWQDLQIPCRWVPDMGYGNGFPLFNYYGVFPYYIGAFLSLFLGFLNSAKALFFIPLVMGGFSMYFLANALLGRIPAVFAAVLFLFAPYRALDSYTRGAIAESFSIAVAPLVFYFGLKLAKNMSRLNFLGFVLTLGAFLTMHNIMTLFFTPILLAWMVYWMIAEKPQILKYLMGAILGFGAAAYFLLPSFFEKGLVQTDSLTKLELDFRAHFITLKQLFFHREWGYGASFPGYEDTISFQIGWPHWWLVALLVTAALILKLMKKQFLFSKLRKDFLIILFWFLSFSIGVFMSHSRSSVVWELFPILHFAQFPWRFLSIIILSASLLGGYFLNIFSRKYQLYIFLFGVLLIVALNIGFFKPMQHYGSSDSEKLSGNQWENQIKAGVKDYLPTNVPEPKEPAPSIPQIIKGKGEIKNFVKRSNRWTFTAVVEKDARIEVPVFDFPRWEVSVNGRKIDYSNDNYLKRVSLNLPIGEYQITGVFKNTPVRNIGNAISIVSFVFLASFLKYGFSNVRK